MTSQITLQNPLKSSKDYADEQILAAFKNTTASSSIALQWFLEKAKRYAAGCWKKKYGRLKSEEWEQIFAATNFKLIKQIRTGLKLQKEVRLLSYYTTLVKYAILDFFEEKKKATALPLLTNLSEGAVKDEYRFEASEVAIIIRKKLEQITGNKEQVAVMLLFSKGYSHKEIVKLTNYQSERASINAYSKGKSKVVNYIQKYPEEGRRLKALLIQS